MAGKRGGFAADAFHHVAVTGQHVGEVVDHRGPVAVERGAEEPFGDRQADRVGKPLAERTGGRLHADGVTLLGVTGRL